MSVGSRNSQKSFDPGAANHPTDLHSVPSGARNPAPVGTSSEVNQNSSSTVQQTSVSNISSTSESYPAKIIISQNSHYLPLFLSIFQEIFGIFEMFTCFLQGITQENGADNNNLEDLPWSSIDLADIDLFSGSSVAEKDVMHSVLDEMDPTVMHRLFLNEPSVASGANKLSIK